jgi:nuclear pore complex protein Nup133
MDVDGASSILTERTTRGGEEAVFAKSDELTVSFYASLPAELKQALKNASMSFFDAVSERVI